VVLHADCSYCILDIARNLSECADLTASLIFYARGGGYFIFAIITCIVVNFAGGIAIDSAALSSRAGARKRVLITGIIFDLGILARWKYAGFTSR
jgi:alginate O-acetyltransferase complex protein AlgI